MFFKVTSSIVIAGALVGWCAAPATAHFVWIESEADGGDLLVRSGFGEPEGWDPDLIGRMQAARFRLHTSAGWQPWEMKLDATEREYRASIPTTRASAAGAICDFGVIQFGGNPPSWLRYTAKSLLGPPSAWPQQADAEFRIELLAKRAGENVQLTALHLGKPLAGAKIKCFSPKEQRLELTTDENGSAAWPLAGPGRYACYVGTTVAEKGDHGGKSYEALKDYTTLTFIIGDGAATKP